MKKLFVVLFAFMIAASSTFAYSSIENKIDDKGKKEKKESCETKENKGCCSKDKKEKKEESKKDEQK